MPDPEAGTVEEPAPGGGERTPARNRPGISLTLVAVPEPGAVAADHEETFDTGPPVDAIFDAPCEAEIFDDCAYDTTAEEYPCDQEAC